ncbi:hypothetical protein LV89_04020 [Arcicella aurantiaca]|uniref:Uncharacterized protein n=1 Tax=Arcicella aurantiaca TaxID=591202 RepID=A0A316DLW0_9BACT|nr:hypothetical protein [Arcicella aurantiaca]PWK18885.1 hypothetical protein LV89_04020 [Arcicella aurantiaca]
MKEFIIYIIYRVYRYYSKNNNDLVNAKIQSFFVLLTFLFLYTSPIVFYISSKSGAIKYWDDDTYFLERRVSIAMVMIVLSGIFFWIYRMKIDSIRKYFDYFDREFDKETHKKYTKYVVIVGICAVIWLLSSMIIIGKLTK